MNYCIICRDQDKSQIIKEKLIEEISHNYNEENPQIVIAIGGDGTILRASHMYPEAIIFGIHTGHLGFYANYSVDEIDLLINDINNNTYKINQFDLLTANVLDSNGNFIIDNALNEVTIVSPLKVVSLDVYIDDIYFERFRGTGLCISTPNGSTAYNKSLNGCVIDHDLKTIQLTEIAGINSNAYRTLSSPLVLSSKRIIRLESSEALDLYVTVDHIANQVSFKSIVLKYDNKHLKMGYHNNEDFMRRIHRTFLISKE